jgi:hypothetical protein
MSALWPKVTKEHPCKICGHGDWLCRYGDKAQICMRVESPKPSRDGGWYHFYDSKIKPKVMPKRFVPPKVKVDFEKIYSDGLKTTKSCYGLSGELGVSEESLLSLGAVSSIQGIPTWAFPMRDGDNKIIGIHLRYDDGSKKCVTGSQGGLFIPQVEPQKLAYICEGASSCAALLTMGFYAIGRFNCNSGADMLKIALKRLGVTRIVIVADNDTLKTAPNGKMFRPGQDGASRLKKELGLMSVIFTCPNPVKDVRQLLQKLGVEDAKSYIENSIKMKIWTRV